MCRGYRRSTDVDVIHWHSIGYGASAKPLKQLYFAYRDRINILYLDGVIAYVEN